MDLRSSVPKNPETEFMARSKSRKDRIEPRFEQEEPKTRSRKSRRPSRKKQGRHKSWVWRLIGWMMRPVPRLTYWGLVMGLWATIAVAGIFAFYATQLPSADTWVVPERPPNMRVVAIDKSLLANRGVTGGEALRLEEMSPHIAQAVIAIEDRRFHAHFGFDPIGFTRAMVRNVMQKRMREGGSTITQQLAKNLFLNPERTFGRKIQELILSFWLEAKYSKAEILELYLNRVYFGAGATGVDAAARRYFGKSAKHVTVPEAALLAGLLKAPSRYTPARNPDLAQRRARVVMKAMQEEGYIKPGKIDINNVQPGKYAKHFRSGPEHFVSDMVVREVAQLIGDVRGDIVVETTISPFLMTAAHSLVEQSLAKSGRKMRVGQAALVSMAPDGAIRALIGGRDYGKSQFNRAVDAKRQPGSAFKTFVWLKALENGHTSQRVVIDEPIRIGKWTPENYDKRYRGSVTLKAAFSQSLNTVAAKLAVEAGPRNIAALARRMGVGTKLTANASLALGTSEVSLLELTGAYAPLANGGRKIRPHLIKRIISDKGEILYQRKPDRAVSVLLPHQISGMNEMLVDVVARGTGRKARLKNHIAGGKTGTSQGFRDALFVGHTAHLVTGVWFGNDDNAPTKNLTGGSLPAMVWRDFMETAHRDLKPKPLPGAGNFAALATASITTPTRRPNRRLADSSVSNRSVDRAQTASVKTDLRKRVNKELNQKGSGSILRFIFGD